jgi:hypothetical protein
MNSPDRIGPIERRNTIAVGRAWRTCETTTSLTLLDTVVSGGVQLDDPFAVIPPLDARHRPLHTPRTPFAGLRRPVGPAGRPRGGCPAHAERGDRPEAAARA